MCLTTACNFCSNYKVWTQCYIVVAEYVIMAAQLPDRKAKVWLLCFKYYKGVRGSLSRNILREVCAYFTDLLFLYQVTSDFLYVFNCQSSRWDQPVRLYTKIEVNEGSTWVVLRDGRVQWRRK